MKILHKNTAKYNDRALARPTSLPRSARQAEVRRVGHSIQRDARLYDFPELKEESPPVTPVPSALRILGPCAYPGLSPLGFSWAIRLSTGPSDETVPFQGDRPDVPTRITASRRRRRRE